MKPIVIIWELRLLAPKLTYCSKITEKTEEAYIVNRRYCQERGSDFMTQRIRGNGAENKSELLPQMFMQMV